MREAKHGETDAEDGGASAPSSTALAWTKALIVPLFTLAVTVLGGYFIDKALKDRESTASNAQLYAQLLTQREASDAQLRKDMFGVVIQSFLSKPKEGDWSDKVLQLELLATNFNQSLDLAPLFKDTARRLHAATGSGPALAEWQDRLDRTAANLVYKQVSALARRGLWRDAPVAVSEIDAKMGTPWIEDSVPLKQLVPAVAGGELHFAVEVVGLNLETREVEVRLRANLPGRNGDLDRHFWVGLYDFPMLDNTQLSDGLRASVVLTEFFVPRGTPDEVRTNSFLRLNIVIFPASSASFKERQDYDDVVADKLRISEGRTTTGPSP